MEYAAIDPGYTPIPAIVKHDENVIRLEWAEATGCGGLDNLPCHYQVTVQEHNRIESFDVHDTTYTFYRPVPGVKYCFDVTPCNRCGVGSQTQLVCVHHEYCQTPQAVGQPAIQKEDEYSIFVSW